MLSTCRLVALDGNAPAQNEEVGVDTELVSRIARTPQSTAANKRLPRIEDSTSYVEVRLAECHSVLDDAVRILGDVSIIDSGVLLASYNGLTDKVFSNALVDVAWASS
jgi:hypothetical protein